MQVQSLPPADSAGRWPLDRKSFAAARARCGQAVLLDPGLSGAEKRVIAVCLYKPYAYRRAMVMLCLDGNAGSRG